MRVNRIEIFGFKSFMDRLILPIESGITGVVGPNGCGKSNIVDAIRWVLGETRASNLRGDSLEDVIFNGTENLRPLGLAEVTLTLRSASGNFFADITNSYENTADFNEQLFSDLEAASERVNQLLDARHNHNTTPFHENSSFSAEDNNQEKPYLKVIKGNIDNEKNNNDKNPSRDDIAKTSDNKKESYPLHLMQKFSWLKSSNEMQITRRLYRNGESEFFINRVPCRLKDIKEICRALGLGARAFTIVAQGEVSRIISAKPEERRQILEEAAGVAGFRDKINAAKKRLEDTAVNLSRLDDLIAEVSKQVSILKRQAQRAMDRKTLKEKIFANDKIIFQQNKIEFLDKLVCIKKELDLKKQLEANAEAELNQINAFEQKARSLLMKLDLETDEIRLKIDNIREEINNRLMQRSKSQLRINELKAYAVSTRQEMDNIKGRLQQLNLRKDQSLQELNNLTEDLNSKKKLLFHLEQSANDKRLKEVLQQIANARKNLAEKESSARDLRDLLIGKQSIQQQIKKQIIAITPLNKLEETLNLSTENFSQDIKQELTMIADILEVPHQYVSAVEAVLGEKANFLISEKPHQLARYFIDKISEINADLRDSLTLGFYNSNITDSLPIINRKDQSLKFAELLLDKIKCPPQYRAMISKLFFNVYLVENIQEAFQYFADLHNNRNITFVTLAGDIITADYFYSFRERSGIIDFKQKILEIDKEIERYNLKYNQAIQEKSAILNSIQELENSQNQLLHLIQQEQVEIREASNQVAALESRLDAEGKLLQQIDLDLLQANETFNEIEQRLINYTLEEQQVIQQLESSVPQDEIQIKKELELLKSQQQILENDRKSAHQQLAVSANNLAAAREKLDNLRQEVSQFELEIQKLNLENTNYEEKFINEYGIESMQQLIHNLSDFARIAAEEIALLKEENARLKMKIQKEGDVDAESIALYEEQKLRLDNLNLQRSDLKKAAETLKQTIELLTDTCKNKFLSTYQAVRKNFSHLIPRLFAGGRGDLLLLDDVNPLDSGVDIFVRPPGKKLSSIELLSGGEKALCATALIFAMFLQRPGPLCVLDEVDAPLDDANLTRLIALIKEISQRTQFMMITHNKQTMMVADNLVGVTMQEPGASKVISVSLQEAYSQVA